MTAQLTISFIFFFLRAQNASMKSEFPDIAPAVKAGNWLKTPRRDLKSFLFILFYFT